MEDVVAREDEDGESDGVRLGAGRVASPRPRSSNELNDAIAGLSGVWGLAPRSQRGPCVVHCLSTTSVDERLAGPPPTTSLASREVAGGRMRGRVVAVRLEWEGKPKKVERLSLPFQTVETINESRATRERDAGALFAGGSQVESARNQLIWGDNKLVMSSLIKKHAGEVRLVYIDPPFDTGADFSFRVSVGDAAVTKQPSVLEEHAYRDTWGRGRSSYLSMMSERLALIH